MYKSKITEWGLDKKKKKVAVLAILRKKAERDAVGKSTVFKLKGREVDFKDVQRYARRNHISGAIIEGLIAFHPQTPPDLRCFTPEPVPWPITGKDVCRVHEQLLRDLKTYMIGSFDQKIWTSAPDGLGIIVPTWLLAPHSSACYPRAHFLKSIQHANQLLASGKSRETVLCWNSACAVFGTLVRTSLFDGLVDMFVYIHCARDRKAVSIFCQHIFDMATSLLSINDPRRPLYCTLSRLGEDELVMLLPVMRRLVAEKAEDLAGEYSAFSISRRLLTMADGRTDGEIRDWLAQTLTTLESLFGPNDLRSLMVFYKKALCSYVVRDSDTSEKDCRQLLQPLSLHADQLLKDVELIYLHQRSLEMLACAQRARGDYHGAIRSLRYGIEMAESGDLQRGILGRILSHLEDLLRKTGDIREAEQINVRRITILMEDIIP